MSDQSTKSFSSFPHQKKKKEKKRKTYEYPKAASGIISYGSNKYTKPPPNTNSTRNCARKRASTNHTDSSNPQQPPNISTRNEITSDIHFTYQTSYKCGHIKKDFPPLLIGKTNDRWMKLLNKIRSGRYTVRRAGEKRRL
jgi:hypothetical protein